MPGAAAPDAAAATMRLEPLLFAGYERLDSGSGAVRLITPQGGCVLLHPSHPSFLVVSPPLHEQLRLSAHPTHLPSSPPRESLRCEPIHNNTVPAAALAEAKRALGDAAMPHASTSAAAMLPAPPEGFEVEFFSSLSSAESSVASSCATSRGASPPPEAAAPKVRDAGRAPADGASAGGDQPPLLDETAGARARGSSEESLVLHTRVHGTELVASSAVLAELDAELTRRALVLFDGKLPQPPPPPPGQAEAHPQWAEVVNYHRAVLLGYDDAGLAYLDAQALAQRSPPPRGWRLCPLPLLVCGVTELAHFYRDANPADRRSERSTVADASDSAARYPVLPRAARAAAAGSSEGLENARPNHNGRARTPLAPPLHPTPASGEPPPFTTSTIAPLAPSSKLHPYLSPPLRWSLPACGRVPTLDLQQLFQVQPNCVYELGRPPEEVVFLGVALGVPWILPVTLATATASGSTRLPMAPRLGVEVDATAPSTSLPASQPPAGYRWKDMCAWAEPLVGCHDAHDIRGRHGLAGPTPAATGVHSTAAVADAEGSVPHSAPPPVVAGVPPKETERAPSPTSEATGKNGKRSPPPPPSPRRLTAAGPLFVKEGNIVFVPGRFGVMLECNTNPALMAARFGIVYGDWVVARALSPHGAAAPLSDTPNRGKLVTPPLPPGPLMVMGLHGGNVLVLQGNCEGDEAVRVRVTHGVSEVSEAFRKVSGAPLSPPALPIEPLSMPASPPESPTAPEAVGASHLMAEGEDSLEQRQVSEMEQREDQADPMCSTAIGTFTEIADTVATPAAAAAAASSEAQCGMDAAAGTQGVGASCEDAGIAAPMADGGWSGVSSPAKAAILVDPNQVGTNAASFSSEGAVGAPEVTPMMADATPHARRWSSTTSSSASAASSDSLTPKRLQQQQQSRLNQAAEEKKNHSGLSMARARALSTPMQDMVVEATGAWLTSAAQLLQPAEEVTVVPVVTPTTADAPPLMTLPADECAAPSIRREVVFEAEADRCSVEAASTDPPRDGDMRFHAHEVGPADARPHEVPLLQLPAKDRSVLEGGTEQHPPQGSSVSVPSHSSGRMLSGLPAPSSAMPQPSERQHADEVQEATLDARTQSSDAAGDIYRRCAGLENEDEERAPHARRVYADDDGALSAALYAPSLLAPPQPQPWANEAPPSSHAVTASSEEAAATAGRARSPKLPEVTMPRSCHAEEVLECCAAPPAPPPPLTAHPAVTCVPPYSSPSANSAAHSTATQARTRQVTSCPTLASPPCAATVGRQHCSTATASKTITAAISTPFTNFLKAYAIHVLGTHVELSGGESKQLCNGAAPRVSGNATEPGEPLQRAVTLAAILDFYREQPLTRIMEATAIQRRCCAAWKSTITSGRASAALPFANDMPLCKLKASASTTVFEELCVSELVSLLFILYHSSPIREESLPR
ncbi:hypothetical protein GH5_06636 [Leishmania sp. Ghana 2012 LV757]|uniref:hypothetical protein n=1 Tax=Leishmania sp. Ghana 2012 LV757 TaxID=2803181 RepID=UPI001B62A9C8|nr:hypothetical protein GH5_06636 [Leishmania sp. Ghana 2012 LV757]